ncbi:MAG: hypothetical protein HN904_11100 [Victivallales bacterium]|nr:hypothetical protein [Victivallales bacterium]
MAEEKKRWKWWQKLSMAMTVIVLILIAAFIGLRGPWIRPLPGVSLELRRRPVPASALGPNTAYRLLLEAIADPVAPPVAPESGDEGGMFGDGGGDMSGDPVEPIWGSSYNDAWEIAETKFEYHPWPATPPPPFATVAQDTSTSEEGGQVSGMSAPRRLAPEDPWTLEQYQEIPRLMAVVAPRVALLDRALAASDRRMPVSESIWRYAPDLSQCVSFARWLVISAQYRAATGDHDGSHRDLARILDLGSLLRHGSAAGGWITDERCSKLAASAARRIAMRSPLPGDLLRREARTFLDCADRATPFADIIRTEAHAVPALVSDFYASGFIDLGEWMQSGGGYRPPWPKWRDGAIFRLAPLLGSTPKTTARNLQTVYQHLIPIAEKPYSAALRAEYDRFQRSLTSARSLPRLLFGTLDPLGHAWAGSWLFESYGRIHSAVTAHAARMRGMALFLGIKAYEKEHGSLPETLAKLVPDYLPRIPKDPFDGKPFRYLRSHVPGLRPKVWAIYSIGEDFTDDGGKAHSVGKARDDHGPNPDLVWPSREYPKPLPPMGPGGMSGG